VAESGEDGRANVDCAQACRGAMDPLERGAWSVERGDRVVDKRRQAGQPQSSKQAVPPPSTGHYRRQNRGRVKGGSGAGMSCSALTMDGHGWPWPQRP